MTLKLLINVSILWGLSCALIAEPRTTMNAIDIINVSSLEESAISPNGKQMAFIKADANWKLNKIVQNIWISNLSGGSLRQLTFDDSGKTRLRWSPDGEAISFVSQRKGLSNSSQFKGIYRLPINGGEARELTSHRADIRSYRWSSDSKSIYFLASELLDASVAEAKKNKDDMFPFEEALSYQHIWHLDIEKNFTRQVTHGKFHVLGFDLSNNDEFLAYNRAEGDLPDDWFQSEIWVSDKYGGNQNRLTDNHYAERHLEFSPDDKPAQLTEGKHTIKNWTYNSQS